MCYRQTHDRGEKKICAQVVAGSLHLTTATAEKHLATLEDKGLVAVERSCWFNEVRLKRNGNNVYTILPIRAAVEDYHQQQLRRLELDAQRRRALQRQDTDTRRHSTAALCAADVSKTTPDPPPAA